MEPGSWRARKTAGASGSVTTAWSTRYTTRCSSSSFSPPAIEATSTGEVDPMPLLRSVVRRLTAPEAIPPTAPKRFGASFGRFRALLHQFTAFSQWSMCDHESGVSSTSANGNSPPRPTGLQPPGGAAGLGVASCREGTGDVRYDARSGKEGDARSRRPRASVPSGFCVSSGVSVAGRSSRSRASRSTPSSCRPAFRSRSTPTPCPGRGR